MIDGNNLIAAQLRHAAVHVRLLEVVADAACLVSSQVDEQSWLKTTVTRMRELVALQRAIAALDEHKKRSGAAEAHNDFVIRTLRESLDEERALGAKREEQIQGLQLEIIHLRRELSRANSTEGA